MNKNLRIVYLLFIISFHSFSQSGKLEKGKKSLKTTNSTKSSSKRTTSVSRNSNNNIQNPFIKILSYVAAYTVYGIAFETPFEFNGRMHDAEIAHFPYENSAHGNFIYTNKTDYSIARFDVYNRFLIENKNLYGNQIGVDFRFFKRFSMDVNYVSFVEKINGNKDSFNMYAALLKYHRIRTQKLDMWFGLGATHVANNVDKTGFTFGVGAEWFIAKPISLLLSHKATSINNNSINDTKVLLKYHLKNYRISTGYENYKLGDSKINTFSIGVEASF